MRKHLITSITMATTLVATLAVGAVHHTAFAAETTAIEQDAHKADAHQRAFAALDITLNDKLTAATADLTVATTVLEQRPGFVEQVAGARGTIDAANGKVDAGPYTQRVKDAQAAALAASTPEQVAEHAGAVKAASDELAQKIAEFDAEQARKAEEERQRQAAASKSSGGSKQQSTGNRGGSGGGGGSNGGGGGSSSGASGGGGGDWYSYMGNLLSQYGSRMELRQDDGTCQGRAACTNGVYVWVNPNIMQQPEWYRHYVAAHETAHAVFWIVRQQARQQSGFMDLFGGDEEFIADCMAGAKGTSTNGRNCSPRHLEWARGIWNGQVLF